MMVKKKRALILSVFIVILSLAVIPAGAAGSKTAPFPEIKEKLLEITEEEKEVLNNLFILAQEIELMESEEKKLMGETDAINREIAETEDEIKEIEAVCERKRKSLGEVLKSYQRMGPGSFLEIVLDSDSLEEFLHRINILRDITRNTEELLEQLKTSGENLVGKKDALSAKLILVEDKQRQLKEAMTKKTNLRLEKERYLASLKGEVEYYREYSENIEKAWNELKPVISEAGKEFSHIIEKGSLPADALKITFSLFSVKGSIEDKVINKIVSGQTSLPDMVFAFHPGRVEISLPGKDFAVSGTFVVLDGHILKFRAQEGSFFGMPLETGTVEELFAEGGMELDLKSLLAGNTINSLEIKEGYLELTSSLNLFQSEGKQ